MHVHNRFNARGSTLLQSVIGLLVIASTAHAATRTVPGQFSTIQAAINASASGDVIDVAPGTYKALGNFNLNFGTKDLTLESTGGPTVTILDNTGGTQANQKQTVTLNGGQTAATVIKGFTIKNSFHDSGGAISIVDCTATITQCIFLNNTAPSEGGAIDVVSNGSVSGAIISQCLFLGNTAGNLTDTSGFGGAIRCNVESGTAIQSVTITNCIFNSNTATYDGGAIDIAGPSTSNPRVSVINCSFVKNNANGFVASDDIESIAAPSAGQQPGVVDVLGGKGVLTNCVLYGDTAPTEISTLNSGWSASFSDINQGGFSGNSNINLPPKCVNISHSDPRLDDLHVFSDSPLIGVGASVGNVDANGVSIPSIDLENQPRHATPDIGTYEIHTPTAKTQSVATLENTALAITLTGSDTNTQAPTLTYAILSSPTHGILSGTAPNLTYTPTANYSGPDSFTFTVNNGNYTSAAAAINITVTPVARQRNEH